MEKKKPVGTSSSFTSDLFGSRESSSSSNEIFGGSIFSSCFKGSEVGGKTQDFSNDKWCPETEHASKSKWKSQSTSRREGGSFYHEQRPQPCHLSSSIYYGGQDVYSHSNSTQNIGSGLNTSFKKDGGEDDSDGASRGNWWQGSLYY